MEVNSIYYPEATQPMSTMEGAFEPVMIYT